MLKICLIFAFFALSFSYLEVPLSQITAKDHVVYAISIEISDIKYKLEIALDKQTEYLNVSKDFPAFKQNSQKTGILLGHSLQQNNNVEGWRRYFSQAFFFTEQRYIHQFTLDLDWMKIKRNHSSISNGVISLSPSIINNRFFNQIKKNYPHMTVDMFAIYMGPSNSKNTIQFGGYEITYAHQTIDGHFHKVEMQDNQNQWVIKTPKILFSKDNHGRYADFVLLPQEQWLKLSLSHNKLYITKDIINVLLIALESQNIECKFETHLVCSNMTSLDLSLHQFVFPVNPNFSVNISLYRLVNECDSKLQHCSFNVEISQIFEIGSVFFKDHYTVFNMEEKHILIGLNNKYPTEWFSTVYIIRAIILLVVVMFITAFVVESKYVKFFRQRKDEIEGIELVSHQQLHQY